MTLDLGAVGVATWPRTERQLWSVQRRQADACMGFVNGSRRTQVEFSTSLVPGRINRPGSIAVA